MANKKRFKILGMHCVSCAKNIEEDIGKIPGVSSVKVDFVGKKMLTEGENFSIEEIKKKTGISMIFRSNWRPFILPLIRPGSATSASRCGHPLPGWKRRNQ